ncbi:MAG: ArsI/CadI family heavy metal resistance metalloenzyme [Acidimicrobiia bacterium]
MARLQLALNVSDLDEAVDFYRRLFGTDPTKRRDGYANFAVADPPLKLVLFEGSGEPGTLNHLGVEMPTTAEVTTATRRIGEAGLEPGDVSRDVCCHAEQDKAWVTGPDDAAWELYTVVDDDPTSDSAGGACCSGPVAGPDVTAAR